MPGPYGGRYFHVRIVTGRRGKLYANFQFDQQGAKDCAKAWNEEFGGTIETETQSDVE